MAAPACTRWRQPSGTTQREIVVAGVTRTYLFHAGGEEKPGRPLILVLHGWRGSADGIQRRTRGAFDRLADRDGAIVVYPQALGDPRWNDGDGPQAGAPDDVGFLAALIAAAVSEQGVDRTRVFATGLSNGARMVYRLACERPELMAAAAPVSGGMAAAVARACPRGAPVAMLVMHGTGDPIVPFGDWIGRDVETWVRRDGCPAAARTSLLPDADPNDGTTTRVALHEPCAAGTAVALWTIEGGGHQWPGGASRWRNGNTARDFDAAEVIWDFFKQHPRR
jgi:polyhydroxybutyrate depolymerase